MIFFGGWQVVDLPKRFRDDKKSSRARLGLTAHCLITTRCRAIAGATKRDTDSVQSVTSTWENLHCIRISQFVLAGSDIQRVMATDCCLQQKSTVRNWTSIHLGRSDHIDVGPSTRFCSQCPKKAAALLHW